MTQNFVTGKKIWKLKDILLVQWDHFQKILNSRLCTALPKFFPCPFHSQSRSDYRTPKSWIHLNTRLSSEACYLQLRSSCRTPKPGLVWIHARHCPWYSNGKFINWMSDTCLIFKWEIYQLNARHMSGFWAEKEHRNAQICRICIRHSKM